MITFLRKRRPRWYGHVFRKEGEDTTRKMLNMCREREEGKDTTKKMLNMCREREEGKDTTKKMLNMQVQGKRRREGYHQEDVKHASAGKEKKERIPPRRC